MLPKQPVMTKASGAGDPPVKCFHCPGLSSWRTQEDLKRHVEAVHRQHPCERCGKVYYLASSFRKHDCVAYPSDDEMGDHRQAIGRLEEPEDWLRIENVEIAEPMRPIAPRSVFQRLGPQERAVPSPRPTPSVWVTLDDGRRHLIPKEALVPQTLRK